MACVQGPRVAQETHERYTGWALVRFKRGEASRDGLEHGSSENSNHISP
jgi:hypothetical protein